ALGIRDCQLVAPLGLEGLGELGDNLLLLGRRARAKRVDAGLKARFRSLGASEGLHLDVERAGLARLKRGRDDAILAGLRYGEVKPRIQIVVSHVVVERQLLAGAILQPQEGVEILAGQVNAHDLAFAQLELVYLAVRAARLRTGVLFVIVHQLVG